MLAKCPDAKCLIFSQYSSTLSALGAHLASAGYNYRTITGAMSMKNRKAAIEAFQNDPPTTVFLLSMRSGCMGINLTAASHVFLLEPALNPALQDQAIGRSWRMGQQSHVTVKKFYIKVTLQQSLEGQTLEILYLHFGAHHLVELWYGSWNYKSVYIFQGSSTAPAYALEFILQTTFSNQLMCLVCPDWEMPLVQCVWFDWMALAVVRRLEKICQQ